MRSHILESKFISKISIQLVNLNTNLLHGITVTNSYHTICLCRITRDGEQIFEGALASLKRFKDDVKEVATGYECGLVFEKFNDIKEDDMVEAYMMVEVPR